MKKLLLSIYIAVFFIPVFMCAQAGWAGNVFLNASELEIIESACPGCLDEGMLLCGNSNIGFGRHFRNNFFSGKPPRGFLISPPILSSDFQKAVRNVKDHELLLQAMKERFEKMKLIVVASAYSQAYCLDNGKVEVVIPDQLHSCLQDNNKKWGCGVSETSDGECCEKGLGSAMVKVTWIDHHHHQQEIMLQYSPHIGSTRILVKEGQTVRIAYFCHNSEPACFKAKKSK